MLVQSWIEPLVYLQTTLDRYDDAPDMLLNKTKWVSDKLISLEQGVVVLIKKVGQIQNFQKEYFICIISISFLAMELICFQIPLCRCWMREFWPQTTVNKACCSMMYSLRCWNLSWETTPYSAASRKMPIRWRLSSSFSSADKLTNTTAHKAVQLLNKTLFSFKWILEVHSRALIDMTMP